MQQSSASRNRNRHGSLLTEFSAAFTIFVCCLLIPLLNLSVIPLRYVVAYALVSSLTHKAATAETRSQAIALANNSEYYQNFASRFGFSLGASSLSIVCKNRDSKFIILPEKKPIPAVWLPGGSRSDCNYLLQLETVVSIPPLFCVGPKITALTAPVSVMITSNAPWENLGRDPSTEGFFINE